MAKYSPNKSSQKVINFGSTGRRGHFTKDQILIKPAIVAIDVPGKATYPGTVPIIDRGKAMAETTKETALQATNFQDDRLRRIPELDVELFMTCDVT